MFKGRGEIPTVEGNKIHNMFYFYRRRYYFIKYDEKFVLMEIIANLLILALGFATYVLAYKPEFVDPIEGIKKIYINSQIISMITSLTLIMITMFFSKTKEILIKRLKIILILSMLAIMVFVGIKIGLNIKYNNYEKFSKYYEISEVKENEELNKNNIKVALTGIEIRDIKQAYIEDNMKAYKYFTYKTTACTVLYAILVIFNVSMIIKVANQQESIDKMQRDDSILFDEEENVKF